MWIQRTRKFSVNMGNFENYTFEASVGAGHNDVGVSNEELVHADKEAVRDTIVEFVMQNLNDLLYEEIQDAVSLTDERKSFILASFTQPKAQKRK